VNSYDLLTALGAAHQNETQAAQIDLIVEADPALPLIQGNVEELNTALSQLLRNALQHTTVGDRITLRNQLQNESTLAIIVEDTGMGISPETLPRIFDRFYRGSDSQNALGFGLGLAIVERILDGHQGRVRVDSEMGVGSTFTVELPLAQPDQDRPRS
jgi:signal transduction histidine kinase